MQPQVFPDLPKLKHLKLKVHLRNDVVLVLTSLVEACPNLHRFTCQVPITKFNCILLYMFKRKACWL